MKSPRRPSFAFPIAVVLTTALTGLVAYTVVGVPPKSAPLDAASPLGVAETLDSIVQPRFYTFEDMRFGMSRIAVRRKVAGHPLTRFVPENEKEKAQFASVDASGRDYMILFYRSAPPPPTAAPYLKTPEAEFRFIQGSNFQGSSAFFPMEVPPFDSHKSEWLRMAQQDLPRLKRGEKINHDTADWVLTMRPVKNNEKCISCHVGSKPEDMLGIMVYAVDKTARRQMPAKPAVQRSQSAAPNPAGE